MKKGRVLEIRNKLADEIVLNLEPESVLVRLRSGESVNVFDEGGLSNARLDLSRLRGDLVISLWPGDGGLRVEKNGVDIMNETGRPIGDS
jgi:hypothetical protein